LSTSNSKTKGLAWIVLAIIVAGLAAMSLPRLARHVPWRVENWLAAIVGGPSPGKSCTGRTHPESIALFRELAKRVYPVYPDDNALPITIEVIGGKTVNAFATLGGHIYVFDGLLRQAGSAEELAGILAHEIEHVRNRHIMQGIAANLFTVGVLGVVLPGDAGVQSGIARLLVMLRFSRQQEQEADEMGLQRLQAAHVDAAGFQQFFLRAEKMASPPEILSSHPANEMRAKLAATFHESGATPIMDANQWKLLQRICD
jgi:Zn-dependent protease with chaperone function